MRLFVVLAFCGLLASCKPEKLPSSPPGLNVYPAWVDLMPVSELHRGSDNAKPLRFHLSNGKYPPNWPEAVSLQAMAPVFVRGFTEKGSAAAMDRYCRFFFITGMPVDDLIDELKRALYTNGYSDGFDGTTWGSDPGTSEVLSTSVTGYKWSKDRSESILFMLWRDPALGEYTYVRAKYSETPRRERLSSHAVRPRLRPSRTTSAAGEVWRRKAPHMRDSRERIACRQSRRRDAAATHSFHQLSALSHQPSPLHRIALHPLAPSPLPRSLRIQLPQG